jgi:hypothetical protein
MRRALSLAAVLLLSVLLWPAGPANAQKAKKDDEPKNTTKAIKGGTLVGKVTNVDEGHKIRLDITYPVTTIDNGALQQVNQAQQRLVQAQYQLRLARDINGLNQARQQMAQAQQQLQQAQARVYKTEMKNKELYVQAIDDVVVRSSKPIPRFDDKGELKKKFTRAELKELRGNGKLPGYKANYEDVQVDQIVQVTLVKKKGAKPVRPKKGKPEDALGDAVGDETPSISMILIMRLPVPDGKK